MKIFLDESFDESFDESLDKFPDESLGKNMMRSPLKK